MTTQRNIQKETQDFSIIMGIDLYDSDRSKRGGWSSDARLEVLTREIIQYAPELAHALERGGMHKIAA